MVFRTSQAYNRFWEGSTSTHVMRAEWFDACAGICAFCKHSSADKTVVLRFQHMLIRLFSMMHAQALAEIEDTDMNDVVDVRAFQYQLIDVEGIDEDSLAAIRDSDTRCELIYQWIQQIVVENISTGVLSIPPPILSRCFQQLSNGMNAFHAAGQLSQVLFPFPYIFVTLHSQLQYGHVSQRRSHPCSDCPGQRRR